MNIFLKIARLAARDDDRFFIPLNIVLIPALILIAAALVR